MRQKLSLFADVAVVFAAIAVIALSLRARQLGPDRPDPVRVKIDETLFLPGVDFGSSPRTLVLVANSNCKYCARSLPFYRRLSELQGHKSGRFQLVVVGSESSEILRGYLEKASVKADGYHSIPGPDMPSVITPTLILVDRNGSVKNVWRGFQSPSGETSVQKALS